MGGPILMARSPSIFESCTICKPGEVTVRWVMPDVNDTGELEIACKDPNDLKNALITDIKLAPRNARGRVEYIATFSLMKPIDMTHSSGVLMYTVVNRGNGAAASIQVYVRP